LRLYFDSCIIINRDDPIKDDVWERFHIIHDGNVKVIKISGIEGSDIEIEETWGDLPINEFKKVWGNECPEVTDEVTVEIPKFSNVSCLDGHGILTIGKKTYYIGSKGSYENTLNKVKCYDIGN